MSIKEDIKRQENDILNAHWKSCINCDNFALGLRICKLVNQEPPLKIIIQGCESWKDEIPF